MKKVFSLLLTCCIFQAANAQHSVKTTAMTGAHANLVNGLLQANNRTHAAAKTTSTGNRVIAQSTRDNTLGTLTDSSSFKYTTYRGSTYDYSNLNYPFNYPYNASPMFDYMGTFTKPQVMYDTCRHWQVDPNTLVYGYFSTGCANYTPDNKLDLFTMLWADSVSKSNMRFFNTFNTLNDITRADRYRWRSGVLDSGFRQFFTYNTANKLIKDSVYEYHLGVWRIAAKTFYTYDLASNLTQIDHYVNTTDTSFLLPLIEQLKYVNTYDISNRLATVEASYYDGTTLAPYIRDTFAYTGGSTFHTAWRQHQWDAINRYWAPMFNMTKILLGGQPDTVYIQGFDSLLNAWVPATMIKMKYNSNNDPDTMLDYEFNFVSFPATPDFTTVYYYETFTYFLKEEPLAGLSQKAYAYPNPATNTLTIAAELPEQTPVSITVMNIAGQTVSKEQFAWRRGLQLPVDYLTPGQYWLSVTDNSGNAVIRQAFIKQ